MTVGFIGAGKVGTAVGYYLYQKGIRISGYHSRSAASAQYAASLTESHTFENIGELALSSDIIMITTPDDTIGKIASELAGLPVSWEARAVCHMSGVYSSDILHPLEREGAAVCSLHPLLSFGDLHASVRRLQTASMTLEGKGALLESVERLLESCGNTYIRIRAHEKALYHAAACIVSNYLVTLMHMGTRMLESVGFEETKAREMLGALAEGTLENTLRVGPQEALTGPISRGDSNTIKKHVEKLAECGNHWLKTYKALGEATAELAKEAGKIDDTLLNTIKEALEGRG